MISLLVCSVGLAVRKQESLQASPDPVASPAASPAPGTVGVDWASGAPLPKAPTAPVADGTAVGAAPVAATPITEGPAIGGGNKACVSIQPGTSDYWCSTTCASGVCPETICKCGDEAAAESDAKVADAMASHQQEEKKVKDAADAVIAGTGSVTDAEQKVKDDIEKKTGEDAAAAGEAKAAAESTQEHDDAEQKVKDAMGANVDEMKDKVASQQAATQAAAQQAAPEAAPAEQAAPEAAEQQAASPSPGATGKKCVAIVATATDQWCENTCNEAPSPVLAVTPTSYCPKEICKCE